MQEIKLNTFASLLFLVVILFIGLIACTAQDASPAVTQDGQPTAVATEESEFPAQTFTPDTFPASTFTQVPIVDWTQEAVNLSATEAWLETAIANNNATAQVLGATLTAAAPTTDMTGTASSFNGTATQLSQSAADFRATQTAIAPTEFVPDQGGLVCGDYTKVPLQDVGTFVPVRFYTNETGTGIRYDEPFQVYADEYGFCVIARYTDNAGTTYVLGFGILEGSGESIAGWVHSQHVVVELLNLPIAASWADYFNVETFTNP